MTAAAIEMEGDKVCVAVAGEDSGFGGAAELVAVAAWAHRSASVGAFAVATSCSVDSADSAAAAELDSQPAARFEAAASS